VTLTSALKRLLEREKQRVLNFGDLILSLMDVTVNKVRRGPGSSLVLPPCLSFHVRQKRERAPHRLWKRALPRGSCLLLLAQSEDVGLEPVLRW
jgi:hypothetical protein